MKMILMMMMMMMIMMVDILLPPPFYLITSSILSLPLPKPPSSPPLPSPSPFFFSHNPEISSSLYAAHAGMYNTVHSTYLSVGSFFLPLSIFPPFPLFLTSSQEKKKEDSYFLKIIRPASFRLSTSFHLHLVFHLMIKSDYCLMHLTRCFVVLRFSLLDSGFLIPDS